jgi:hypothetical protein
MMVNRLAAIGWYHAAVAAVLPWVALYRREWLPAAALLILVAHRRAVSSRLGEPSRSAVVVLSGVVALVLASGWVTAGGWLAAGLSYGALAAVVRGRTGIRRPDALDLAAGALGAGAFVLRPELVEPAAGGWVAPVILALACRRLAECTVPARCEEPAVVGPPTREVRGTLSLSGVVADRHGLVKSSPLELELRAGGSVAILCDDIGEGTDLAWTLCGRRAPASGQVSVDGVPLEEGDRLVAVVAPGEPFLAAGLDENLMMLKDGDLAAGARAAVAESCALSDVEEELKGGPVDTDGRPMNVLHRLLVQTARVVVSHYRIVVVLDPMPWVNPVRGELWRNAVVRASVGRTAVWLTTDRGLAGRADRILELRHGTLKEA